MAVLRRFWLRFSISPDELGDYHSDAGLGLGRGVTAYSLDDAKSIVVQEQFREDPLPQIEQVVEDVTCRISIKVGLCRT